jgi:hypothetical protein
LAGIGAVNGSLVVSPGATVSPSGTNTTIGITAGSSPTGTLAAANNVTLSGTTIIKLNGSGTNDAIQAGASLACGGTLDLENTSGTPLAAGDTFQIFNAADISGSFAQIIPATPGAGLAWDTNQLSSGQIRVVAGGSGPVVSSVSVVNGSLVLRGSGGTASGIYYVLTATNLATPLSSWLPVMTNTYDASGNFTITNAIDPGVARQFYRIQQ